MKYPSDKSSWASIHNNKTRGDVTMRDKLLFFLTFVLSCLLILNIANALEFNPRALNTLHVADSSKVL